MGSRVARSAATGRFVSARTAARSPRTTVVQAAPSGASGYRSAITGSFIKCSCSRAAPEHQHLRRKGTGRADSSRPARGSKSLVARGSDAHASTPGD